MFSEGDTFHLMAHTKCSGSVLELQMLDLFQEHANFCLLADDFVLNFRDVKHLLHVVEERGERHRLFVLVVKIVSITLSLSDTMTRVALATVMVTKGLHIHPSVLMTSNWFNPFLSRLRLQAWSTLWTITADDLSHNSDPENTDLLPDMMQCNTFNLNNNALPDSSPQYKDPRSSDGGDAG
jgi:hypothetical protein